ncbi:MAG: NADH-quinone oxidoreductase subunit G [Austwickia sp.]|nr:NADH-quinone oxidoreductase subunit G [Austwickia sp.]MBK8436121.1 NADH-quinone oxidoreductase subunit G [Austwickia sp.]MBK9101800.1 NADH-quinone oxidoreductase subunit G [Austwickia sp.]
MTVASSPASGATPAASGGDAALASPPPVDLVTMKVDGITVQVPKGSMIIRAAEQLGIEIPRFCDHPLLEPVGACRQCLVDVAMPGPDGQVRPMPKPQPACAMAVGEGMEVRTQHTSAVADKAQQGIMEFLLINHPLDCPVCDKGGECPLQNQAMSHGRGRSRFVDVKRTFAKPVNVSSQVLLDRERCVLCQRCTRFSEQIAGDPFIALVERGAMQQIGTYQEKPFESYFSGNTVQICPVGALTGAAYRFRSRPFDLVSTMSACEHCASGCTLRTDHRRGVVLRRMAVNVPAVNEEWNCDKGRWAFTYATEPNRITQPMVRDASGQLRVASWPEAIEVAARGLTAAAAAGGVGVLTGGRLSSEDAYAYAKFARVVLGTHDIDFRARPHSGEEEAFLATHVVATGPDGDAVTYAELETAKTVLLVGFEPEEESPMVFLRLRKAARAKKTKVFAVAPFATRGLTKMFGTLIPAAPKTETEVLGALADRRAEPPLSAAALALAEGDAVILVGERLATVPGALTAAAALAESTGARLAWIPRRAGERGALEAGCLPTLLPGGRPAHDPQAWVDLAQAWGTPPATTRAGRDGTAIIADAASGALAGLVVGGVELSDLPDPALAAQALRRAFTVSLELRTSRATDEADVVLPIAPLAEKAGAFVNWEGRLIPFEAALDSNAMGDHRVLHLLADEMDAWLGLPTLEATRAEMRSLGSWSGSRPVKPGGVGGGVGKLATGEAVLATWHHLLDAGRLQDGEPFLAGTAPLARARISPTTAQRLDVVDGMAVTITSPRGSLTLPAEITEGMVDHVVWVPTNSPGSRVRVELGSIAGDIVTLSKGGGAQ